jgi:hypothetical protein
VTSFQPIVPVLTQVASTKIAWPPPPSNTLGLKRLFALERAKYASVVKDARSERQAGRGATTNATGPPYDRSLFRSSLLPLIRTERSVAKWLRQIILLWASPPFKKTVFDYFARSRATTSDLQLSQFCHALYAILACPAWFLRPLVQSAFARQQTGGKQ